MSEGYTTDELLVVTAAKEIHDHENVILGIGLPMAAGALAKALYAPNANLMMESGIVDFEPRRPLAHIADAQACRGFGFSTDLFSIFTACYRGYVDVCFLGVAQVDRHGNLNTTVIGDYDRPRVRLPGAGGAPDFIGYAKRTVLTMRGGKFVERLGYRTSPGYLEGAGAREASGLFPRGSGPTTLLSTEGVFRFDPDTRELVLAQTHPGIGVEDVRRKVPWDLRVACDLSVTAAPTAEEVAFIRHFAPELSAGRELALELTMRSVARRIRGQ